MQLVEGQERTYTVPLLPSAFLRKPVYSIVTVWFAWGCAPVPSWVVVLVTPIIAAVCEKVLVYEFVLLMDRAEKEETRGARRVNNIVCVYGGVGRVSEEGCGGVFELLWVWGCWLGGMEDKGGVLEGRGRGKSLCVRRSLLGGRALRAVSGRVTVVDQWEGEVGEVGRDGLGGG